MAAEQPWRPRVPYIITKDGNGDVVNRAGTSVPVSVAATGPAPQASAAPVTVATHSQPRPRPGFTPAQPSPRPGHLPRTRPLYDDSDYPCVAREVHRLEYEPVGTYLVRGNFLYLATSNTLESPTLRLHGVYERIDG